MKSTPTRGYSPPEVPRARAGKGDRQVLRRQGNVTSVDGHVLTKIPLNKAFLLDLQTNPAEIPCKSRHPPLHSILQQGVTWLRRRSRTLIVHAEAAVGSRKK
jgi:hypothetical protein